MPFPLFHNLSLFTRPRGSRTEAVSDSGLRPLPVNTMIKTPSDHLLYSLEGLVANDFERFKFKLQNTSLAKDHSRIPWGQLHKARPVKLASLLIAYYGEEYAVQLTLQVLRAINQNFLAEELHKATGSGKQAPGLCLPRHGRWLFTGRGGGARRNLGLDQCVVTWGLGVPGVPMIPAILAEQVPCSSGLRSWVGTAKAPEGLKKRPRF